MNFFFFLILLLVICGGWMHSSNQDKLASYSAKIKHQQDQEIDHLQIKSVKPKIPFNADSSLPQTEAEHAFHVNNDSVEEPSLSAEENSEQDQQSFSAYYDTSTVTEQANYRQTRYSLRLAHRKIANQNSDTMDVGPAEIYETESNDE